MQQSELSIVIGCEQNRLQEAIALRGVLEAFGHCVAVPEIWAKAFLEVGYQAFIGPAAGAIDVDIDSSILFITGFFYHLNMHRRKDRIYTPQEAVIAAAAMDTHYHCGTQVYQYYESFISRE